MMTLSVGTSFPRCLRILEVYGKPSLNQPNITTTVTFEDLCRLATQISNSRPLQLLSNDPTPEPFLIGDSLTAIVEPNVDHIHINRLSRFQHVRSCRDHFWKR